MQETQGQPWVGKIPWKREWQPTPVFLPGEFHGQRSLGSESDTTKQLTVFTSAPGPPPLVTGPLAKESPELCYPFLHWPFLSALKTFKHPSGNDAEGASAGKTSLMLSGTGVLLPGSLSAPPGSSYQAAL